MQQCAERLREAREVFRIPSLRRFAAHLQRRGYAVDWTTIQRWETGESRIPADYVLIVATETRTSPTWLLTGKGPRPWQY
jgi:hypothetical protein